MSNDTATTKDALGGVGSNGLFGVVVLTRDSKKAKRKRIKETFAKRQQARQWCRNHWHKHDHAGMEILHPDGARETFKWDGIL
jgi:hypothetical protein